VRGEGGRGEGGGEGREGRGEGGGERGGKGRGRRGRGKRGRGKRGRGRRGKEKVHHLMFKFSLVCLIHLSGPHQHVLLLSHLGQLLLGPLQLPSA